MLDLISYIAVDDSFLQIQTAAKSCQMKFMTEGISLKRNQTKSNESTFLNQRQESHFYYNILYPSNKIQCDDCKRDISSCTKILCSQLDYCLSCFANSEPFPSHYHVIGKLSFPVFEAGWTAQEELLLFEGLQKFGFGNWGEIAELIGSGKTKEDVQEHYVSQYLEQPDFLPLPLQFSQGQPVSRKYRSKQFTVNHKNRFNIKETQRASQKISHSPEGTHRVKNSDNSAEVVGFLPKRKQFEVEYDNDAELLLAELEFNEDDSPQEVRMKFRIIDIYNQRLAERNRRKDFVIDRNLLDLKEQTRLDKTRSKQDKEIYNMMKIFSRFSSAEDHQKLVQGIIKEKQIRQRLQELKELKAKGYKTLAEVHSAVQEKYHQQDSKPRKSQGVLESRTKVGRKTKRQMLAEKEERGCSELSKEQVQVCQRFGITARQFVLIKQTMIREAVKQGVLERQGASKIFKIQRNIVDGIFDLLVCRQQISQKPI